jgi:hypothetical protein
MTKVNVYLTMPQREWLIDQYITKLDKIDCSLCDDVYPELVHMKNPELYSECKEFMPDCMVKLSKTGIR